MVEGSWQKEKEKEKEKKRKKKKEEERIKPRTENAEIRQQTKRAKL